MQRDIRPAWLLRLAEELGGIDAGAGQPRNTNLRRAVSTAYYALFHAIALNAARAALPGGDDNEVFGLTRYITHASINQVSKYLAGATAPEHLTSVVTRLRENPELSTVGSTFVALHEKREEADYNHLAEFNRPNTLALVQRAERAVALVEGERESSDFGSFFGLIAAQTRNR